MNVYGFAAGDPVNFGDPLGLSCEGLWKDELAALSCRVEGNCTQSDVAGPRPDLGAKGNLIRSYCGDNDFCKNLFDRFVTARGNLKLSTERFKSLAEAAGRGKKVGAPYTTTWNGQEVIAQAVYFGGTEYERALGTATMYYDASGQAVGVHDTYNFDSKAWGVRTFSGEVMTRLVKSYAPKGAQPFDVDYP